MASCHRPGDAVLQWAPAGARRPERHPAAHLRRVRRQGPRQGLGLAPGERACVSIKGDPKRIVGKAAAKPVTRKLTMPTGNKTRIVKVKTADEAAKTRISVRN